MSDHFNICDVPDTGGVDINSGRSFPTPNDPALHPLNTQGDEFGAIALDAKWTSRNMLAGDITFPAADTSVRLSLDATGDGIWQPAPAGDFEIVVCMRGGLTASQLQMVGPAIIDSSGNGIGTSWYPDSSGSLWNWVLASYIYSSSGNSQISLTLPNLSLPHWLALKKVGTSYTARGSKDGTTWTTPTTANTSAITVDRIGVGRFSAGAGDSAIELLRFNVYNSPTYYA